MAGSTTTPSTAPGTTPASPGSEPDKHPDHPRVRWAGIALVLVIAFFLAVSGRWQNCTSTSKDTTSIAKDGNGAGTETTRSCAPPGLADGPTVILLLSVLLLASPDLSKISIGASGIELETRVKEQAATIDGLGGAVKQIVDAVDAVRKAIAEQAHPAAPGPEAAAAGAQAGEAGGAARLMTLTETRRAVESVQAEETATAERCAVLRNRWNELQTKIAGLAPLSSLVFYMDSATELREIEGVQNRAANGADGVLASEVETAITETERLIGKAEAKAREDATDPNRDVLRRFGL